MKQVSDKLWVEDLSILYRLDRLVEFFPTRDHTKEEKINSVVRFSIYISIILSFYKKDYRYLMIFVPVMIITYFLHLRKYSKENFKIEEERYRKSTLNNPYGNRMPYDSNFGRKRMRNYSRLTKENKELEEEIKENFNANLYRSLDDIYEKKHSQRNFYTMPSTSNIPDEDGEMRKWIYSSVSKNNCKTDPTKCSVYEDYRRRPPIFKEEEEE